MNHTVALSKNKPWKKKLLGDKTGTYWDNDFLRGCYLVMFMVPALIVCWSTQPPATCLRECRSGGISWRLKICPQHLYGFLLASVMCITSMQKVQNQRFVLLKSFYNTIGYSWILSSCRRHPPLSKSKHDSQTAACESRLLHVQFGENQCIAEPDSHFGDKTPHVHTLLRKGKW